MARLDVSVEGSWLNEPLHPREEGSTTGASWEEISGGGCGGMGGSSMLELGAGRKIGVSYFCWGRGAPSLQV